MFIRKVGEWNTWERQALAGSVSESTRALVITWQKSTQRAIVYYSTACSQSVTTASVRQSLPLSLSLLLAAIPPIRFNIMSATVRARINIQSHCATRLANDTQPKEENSLSHCAFFYQLHKKCIDSSCLLSDRGIPLPFDLIPCKYLFDQEPFWNAKAPYHFPCRDYFLFKWFCEIALWLFASRVSFNAQKKSMKSLIF